ncbi:unnamed protein product, partial [Pleuronectes platessa]
MSTPTHNVHDELCPAVDLKQRGPSSVHKPTLQNKAGLALHTNQKGRERVRDRRRESEERASQPVILPRPSRLQLGSSYKGILLPRLPLQREEGVWGRQAEVQNTKMALGHCAKLKASK